MAQVSINWTKNPDIEQVTGYKVYINGASVADIPQPPYVAELDPGIHTVEISPVNAWGEGPKSDPIATPPPASKPVGVSVQIVINIGTQ